MLRSHWDLMKWLSPQYNRRACRAPESTGGAPREAGFVGRIQPRHRFAADAAIERMEDLSEFFLENPLIESIFVKTSCQAICGQGRIKK